MQTQMHNGERQLQIPVCDLTMPLSYTLQLLCTQEQSLYHVTCWHTSKPIPPHHYPSFLMIILFYASEFFMLECRGIHLGRAERAEPGLGVQYIHTTAIWTPLRCGSVPVPRLDSARPLVPSVPSCAVCEGPCRRQNDWHFSGTTRGTVPRSLSCQWCALTLTKPGEKRAREQDAGWAGNSCVSPLHRLCFLCRLQETLLIPRPANRLLEGGTWL